MHLYIHVPFCDGKCAYCGFYSVHYEERKADQFLAALERELNAIFGNRQPNVETVYVGGGTPSVLSLGQIELLTGTVKSRCRLADGAEWTFEGSPNTLTADKLDFLAGVGVNRISAGIQTFDDQVLRKTGRRHTSEQAREVLKEITSMNGIRAGCDLIAGLPGVSRRDWRRDVETICREGLTHASVYALSIEEGTRFCREHLKGCLQLPSEDETIDCLEDAAGILSNAGLERYEVSNYAVKGHECRHNLAYWRGTDYLGIGPGASSRLGSLRRTNIPDLEAYIRPAQAVPREEERVPLEEDLQERLMYHFRLKEGVDLENFCAEWHVAAAMKDEWQARMEYLAGEGILERHGARYVTTPKGMDFADAAAEVFLE